MSDREFERLLRTVAAYSYRPPDELRPYLAKIVGWRL